jgi:PAS domain S-box-containing protein
MGHYFLLEPGDGLLLCGGNGEISHVCRTALERLGHQARSWNNRPLGEVWPQLSQLIIQEHHRIAAGPREHVVVLPAPSGDELATRVRLFATDSGFGVGLLRRRAHRFDDEDPLEGGTYRRLLEAVLDTIQDAVLVTLAEPIDSPGPVIVFANQSLLEQTGYELHHVLGRSPRLFQGPDTSAESTAAIRSSLERWEPSTMQVLNYRSDGRSCWIELKLAPLADPSGWFTHWVSVQRDVSERVEHAQELASRLDDALSRPRLDSADQM